MEFGNGILSNPGHSAGVDQLITKTFRLIGLMAVIITVVACSSQELVLDSGEAEPSGKVIRISGAGGTTGVLKGLAEEYSRTTSDVSFKFLDGSGSGGAVKGVNADALDLGAMSRVPNDSEIETRIDYLTFAEERVAVVTSPDIHISSLSIEQIRAVFTGEIDNWSSVGGPDALIRLIVTDEEDSNTKIIRTGIMGDSPFSETALVMTSETDAKSALNNSNSAIGYLAYSGAIGSAMDVHSMAIDGQHPADEDNDYPLSPRSLGIAFLPEKIDEFQGFVDFLTGSVVQGILSKQGLMAAR